MVDLKVLHKFYGAFLGLYPSAYREEYADEMQVVFTLFLEEAAEAGKSTLAMVVLKEFASLPMAIFLEHLRERRKTNMVKRFGSYFDFTHGSRWEFLTALYPFFLLGVVSPLVNMISLSGIIPFPNPLFSGLAIALLILLAVLFLSGLIAGLPRWSLPYMGFLFSLLSVYGLGTWLNNSNIIPFQVLYDRAWFWGQVAYQGSLWVGLTVLSLLMTALFTFIPLFRRFKEDWTLPVFVLYGALPFALVFTFDDYIHEEPYELFAFLVLIAGMWLYLRAHTLHRRFLALFGGMTFALFFSAVAKAILFSSPVWPYPRFSFTWQNEMMSTVIMWMWIALSMMVPLVVNLLPRLRTPVQAGEPAAG